VSGRVILSRHVTFDETVFPYAFVSSPEYPPSSKPPLTQNLRPLISTSPLSASISPPDQSSPLISPHPRPPRLTSLLPRLSLHLMRRSILPLLNPRTHLIFPLSPLLNPPHLLLPP
jgi:hypothetical protein